MTDTYRGYDLTSVLEAVAESRYETDRNAIIDASDGTKHPPTWEDLHAHTQLQIKQMLLPIVSNVIEQLEQHQPARVQMRPYGYNEAATAERDDPRFYENDLAQHEAETCTVWVYQCNPPAFMVNVLIERMSTFPELMTGEFQVGDSWAESGVPCRNDEDVRLRFWFRAHDQHDAANLYNLLHAVACFAAGVDDMNDELTLSGDESAEITHGT